MVLAGTVAGAGGCFWPWYIQRRPDSDIMPARQDSRDSHVKYHLLERKWQGVCGGVWGYVFVCVPRCALKCVWGCVCVCSCAYLYTHRQSTHKHKLTVHWQRDWCCAQMTLEEREKEANCLITHQRCSMTELNINHHRCRGAFVQSGGGWKSTQRESRDPRLRVIYPTKFTNKEWFVFGLVDTVNFEAVLFSKYRRWFGASYAKPPKKTLQTLAVLWRSCEARSRQERKLVSDTKHVLFKNTKCWYCSKMTVELTPFCQGSTYWEDKKTSLTQKGDVKGGGKDQEEAALKFQYAFMSL